jgi:hypothetical protein
MSCATQAARPLCSPRMPASEARSDRLEGGGARMDWGVFEAYLRAYRFPSVLPMKSVPSTTTGDDSNEPMLKLRVTAVTSSS